jgi:hypothetical protein
MVAGDKRTVSCGECSREFTVTTSWPGGTSGLYRHLMDEAEDRGWKWHVTPAAHIVYTCDRCKMGTLNHDQGEMNGACRPTG